MTAMPFGKHKGRALSELPDGYLAWLLGLSDLRPFLRDALEAERDRRAGHHDSRESYSYTPPPRPTRGLSAPACEELIGAGLRVLALKHHPDRGGDHEHMVQINQAASWLREQAKRVEVTR